MSFNNTVSNICPVCMGDSFYEDEQGALSCVYCGTQSQNYFAESHEIEEQNLLTRIRGNTLKASAPSKKTRIERKIDPIETLELYQFCIQLLFNSVLSLLKLNIEESSHLESTIKRFWFDYLDCWNKSTSKCSIFDSFDNVSPNCQCPAKSNHHPLFPSKPLILGFIYLTLRYRRYHILPLDIVRWCEIGDIPYFTLWECIPEKKRSKKILAEHKSLFTDIEKFIPKVSNIIFHSESLAYSLNIDIPPLNAPLVALHMVHSLGLPLEVWGNYLKLTHVFSNKQPLEGNESIEQHYNENIMATLIMASKFCFKWQKWSYLFLPSSTKLVKNSNKDNENNSYNQSFPHHIYAYNIDKVPRSEIPQLLRQFRKSTPHYNHLASHSSTSTSYKLNKSLKAILDEFFPKSLTLGHLQMQINQSIQNSLVSKIDNTQKINEVFLSSNFIFNENINDPSTDQYLDRIHGMTYHISSSAVPTYMTHVRYMDDITGLANVQFATFLERCANYTYCSPELLNNLLNKLEVQLAQILYKTTNPFKSVRFHFDESAIKKQKIETKKTNKFLTKQKKAGNGINNNNNDDDDDSDNNDSFQTIRGIINKKAYYRKLMPLIHQMGSMNHENFHEPSIPHTKTFNFFSKDDYFSDQELEKLQQNLPSIPVLRNNLPRFLTAQKYFQEWMEQKVFPRSILPNLSIEADSNKIQIENQQMGDWDKTGKLSNKSDSSAFYFENIDSAVKQWIQNEHEQLSQTSYSISSHRRYYTDDSTHYSDIYNQYRKHDIQEDLNENPDFNDMINFDHSQVSSSSNSNSVNSPLKKETHLSSVSSTGSYLMENLNHNNKESSIFDKVDREAKENDKDEENGSNNDDEDINPNFDIKYIILDQENNFYENISDLSDSSFEPESSSKKTGSNYSIDSPKKDHSKSTKNKKLYTRSSLKYKKGIGVDDVNGNQSLTDFPPNKRSRRTNTNSVSDGEASSKAVDVILANSVDKSEL